MQELSKYQKQVLSKNLNVLKITTSHVVYKASFKLHAIEQHLQGVSADEIFKEAGLRLDFFKKDYARNNIKRWLKKYNEEGKAALGVETRGAGSGQGSGRPKNPENLTYEELLKVVEIQNEVIGELKKIRALAAKK